MKKYEKFFEAAPTVQQLKDKYTGENKPLTDEEFSALVNIDPTRKDDGKVGSYTLWLIKMLKLSWNWKRWRKAIHCSIQIN